MIWGGGVEILVVLVLFLMRLIFLLGGGRERWIGFGVLVVGDWIDFLRFFLGLVKLSDGCCIVFVFVCVVVVGKFLLCVWLVLV